MESSYYAFEYASVDAAQTEQFLTERYGSVGLHGRLDRIGMRFAGDDRFQLAAVRFDGTHTATAETDAFVIATATSSSGWEDARDSGDMSIQPVLFRPGVPFTSFTDHTERRSASLDVRALRRTARLLYGQDDLTPAFDGPHPVSSRAAMSWRAVMDLALSFHRAGILRDDLLRATIYRLLAVGALESFRLVGDRTRLRASAERIQQIHRVARDFFHDFASLPITVEDAAEAAGSSTVELAAAFRAHEVDESSPAAYLRDVRLAAAMEDLRTGDPTLGDTVSEIARRWGFGSSSRFASRFRAKYGVTPKWVLDR